MTSPTRFNRIDVDKEITAGSIGSPTNPNTLYSEQHIPVAAEGVSQSTEAALQSGLVVAVSDNGGTKSVDPTDGYASDDAAIQAAHDWIADNHDGGRLHIPTTVPDGTPTTIESTVTIGETSGGDRASVSLRVISRKRFTDALETEITDGSPMFEVVNPPTSGPQNWFGTYIFDANVSLGDNDVTLIKLVDHNQFYVNTGRIGNAAGDVIVLDGACYNGALLFKVGGGGNDSARALVTQNTTGNGPPGNFHILPGTIVSTGVASAIATDAGGGPMSWISGFFEGANGRAQLDLTAGSWTLTDSCTVNPTADGAHAVYFDGNDLFSNAPEIKLYDGDGIHVNSARNLFIRPFYAFTNGGGDAINIVSEPSNSGEVPFEHQIDGGSVTYPSARWTALTYPNGARKYREGQTFVPSGSTATANAFVGQSGAYQDVVWGYASDPGADVNVESELGHWNSGNGQRELKFTEKTGSAGATVDWVVVQWPAY